MKKIFFLLFFVFVVFVKIEIYTMIRCYIYIGIFYDHNDNQRTDRPIYIILSHMWCRIIKQEKHSGHMNIYIYIVEYEPRRRRRDIKISWLIVFFLSLFVCASVVPILLLLCCYSLLSFLFFVVVIIIYYYLLYI